MPPSLSRPTSTGGPTCPSWVIATQDQVSYCGSLRFATRGFRTRELLLPSGCQAWVVPGRAIEPIRVGVTYFWVPCTQMGLLNPWEKSFLYPRVRTIFYSVARQLTTPHGGWHCRYRQQDLISALCGHGEHMCGAYLRLPKLPRFYD